MMEYLRESLERIEHTYPNSATIIAGDFNKLDFKLCGRTFQLKPAIDFPTRGLNTLDQIFSDLLEYYAPPISLPPFGLSDHITIIVKPAFRTKSNCPNKITIKSRDKRPSNIAAVSRYLMEIPWPDLMTTTHSSSKKLSILIELINYGLNTIMPGRSIKVHKTDRLWMTVQLKSLIARRQKALASGNESLFKLLRNKVNRERKRCRKIYYQNKVKELRDTKPRDWWREIKELCGNNKGRKSNIQSILNPDINYTGKELSDKINEAFVSVLEQYSPLSAEFRVNTDDDEPISVTEETVVKKLKEISISRSSGPDDLPNWVLKEFAYVLAPPITDILNSSFHEQKVPFLWKMANVTPLPKDSIISDFNKDLRPISVTSTLSKIAESIIIERGLKSHILSFIDPCQFGFLPGSSTTLALISMILHWLRDTDATSSTVRAILLDYRKAFDLVDHNLLMYKLKDPGVKPTVINWIADFLRNRTQKVKLNNSCFSDWLDIPTGVPQGTRLGPWLFLIMINDLSLSANISSTYLWKFADDTTTSESIPPNGGSSLQENLNHISEWSRINSFQIHPEKCKELIISFKKQPTQFDEMEIEGQIIERVQSAKILGVTLRDDLLWTDHVNIITRKASKRLYLLRQLKRAGIDILDFVNIYCSCIRSTLEYACQVFHSSLPKFLSEEIERIQKRAMRIIFPGIFYSSALAESGLLSLHERREFLSNKLFNDIVISSKHRLKSLLPPKSSCYTEHLRTRRTFGLPEIHTNRFRNSLIMYYASKHSR